MKSEFLVVYVNDKPIKLFRGLKVKHAIGPRKTKRVLEHRMVVLNEDGNLVDVDGALYDGERLYLAPSDPKSFVDHVTKMCQSDEGGRL